MSGFRVYVVAPLLRHLDRAGVDVAAFVRKQGLPAGAAEAPFVDLPLPRLGALFEAAARTLGDAELGVTLGLGLPRSTWDVMQLSCLSAPDLGAALRRAARLMPLLNERVEVEVRSEDDGSMVFEHRVAGEPSALSRHGNELMLTALLTRARAATGVALRPLACWLAHPRPTRTTRLLEVLDVRDAGPAGVAFGSGASGLRLGAADAARPLRTADPVLLEVLDRLTEPSLAPLRGRRGVAASVARQLASELDGRVPVLVSVARKLAMSTRALQRALTEEDTSYRVLVDQVRQTRARQLLGAGLAVDEVAARLGYAETGGFARAFARWTGGRPRG